MRIIAEDVSLLVGGFGLLTAKCLISQSTRAACQASEVTRSSIDRDDGKNDMMHSQLLKLLTFNKDRDK